MSFTVQIKEEISKITGTSSETIACLSAYIRNNGTITDKKITLTTENHFIVEKVKEDLRNLYDVAATEEIIENLNFSNNDLYQITISEFCFSPFKVEVYIQQ